MRIVLFDGLLEAHVQESLARALTGRGHEVHWTGRVWQGDRLPRSPEERQGIREVVDRVLRLRPDALLTFRAAALRPEELQRLRDSGITLLAWFSDDPVLFRACTGPLAPEYDVTLHTGAEEVLELYEREYDVRGVSMPFFTDPVAFPRSYGSRPPEHEVVFLGNTHTRVRWWRYEWLASTGLPVRLFGKVAADPAGLHAGRLATDREVADVLARTTVALSTPQRFSDYAGSRYDFPGLSELGEFDTPSRLVQYAATGLPVVTYRSTPPPPHEMPSVVVREPEATADAVRDLLADPDRRSELSEAAYEWFRRWHTADSRARLLEELIAAPRAVRWLDRTARARLHRLYDGNALRDAVQREVAEVAP